MSRRRGRKQRVDVNDTRTSEEKETEDVAAIDERRLGGDPASSMGLSSLLFSHQKIYLQPTQISTKLDGTMGFYIHLDHFPDDFKKKIEDHFNDVSKLAKYRTTSDSFARFFVKHFATPPPPNN